jgi:hypothetical protein
MLCEICQKRKATVHTTIMSGAVLKQSDFCGECFETSKPSEAGALATALQSGCRYCGGQPYSGSGHSLTAMSGIGNLSFMCKPCAEEYFRFLRLRMPGFGSDTLTKEQAAKLAKYDLAAISIEVEEHMEKWVANKDSQ